MEINVVVRKKPVWWAWGDKSKISKEVFEDLIRLDLKMREATGAVYVTVATLRKFAAEAKKLRDQGSPDQ